MAHEAELLDCQVIPVEEDDNNEPMLVDEEVVEEQQQEQLQPYQLTVFYHTQLIRFEQAFLQWVNDHYELRGGILNSNERSNMVRLCYSI